MRYNQTPIRHIMLHNNNEDQQERRHPEHKVDPNAHVDPPIYYPHEGDENPVQHIYQEVDWKGRYMSIDQPRQQTIGVLRWEQVQYPVMLQVPIISTLGDLMEEKHPLPPGLRYKYTVRAARQYGVNADWLAEFNRLIALAMQLVLYTLRLIFCLGHFWPIEVIQPYHYDMVRGFDNQLCPLYLKEAYLAWWKTGNRNPADPKVVANGSVYLRSLIQPLIINDRLKDHIFTAVESWTLEVAMTSHHRTNLESVLRVPAEGIPDYITKYWRKAIYFLIKYILPALGIYFLVLKLIELI